MKQVNSPESKKLTSRNYSVSNNTSNFISNLEDLRELEDKINNSLLEYLGAEHEEVSTRLFESVLPLRQFIEGYVMESINEELDVLTDDNNKQI